MGSAAVFEMTGQNDLIVEMTQTKKLNPSANKAELASHSHIIGISSTTTVKTNERHKDILNKQDFPLVKAIFTLFDKFDHSVVFNKIQLAGNCAKINQ
jgi:ornithine cyclodeaminase/alanine dehydrogenase-like protein (mu-crystallin family)